MNRLLVLAATAALSVSSLFACINPGHPEYSRMLMETHLEHYIADLDKELQAIAEKDGRATENGNATNPNPVAGGIGADASSSHIPAIAAPNLNEELRLLVGASSDANVATVHTLPERRIFDRSYWAAKAKSLATTAKTDDAPFSVVNEYAAALIYSGKTKEAIKLLRRLESRDPGHYETATNLGTAYELINDLPNAQKWIQAGIDRNPESHLGTEWLHLAILKAKQNVKRDRRWLATHSVLEGELDIEEANSRRRAKKALIVQIAERVQFVKQPDPYLADALYQLGRIFEKENRGAEADVFYNRSRAYGDLRRGQINRSQESRLLKSEYTALVALARDKLLPELLLAGSQIEDEKCCAHLKRYCASLLENPAAPESDVSDITYGDGNYWKSVVAMSRGNQLMPAITACLLIADGNLDTAKRIVDALSPMARSENFEANLGSEAILALQQNLQEFYDDIGHHIERGIALHDTGKPQEAIVQYEIVLAAFPKSAWANWEVQLSKGDFIIAKGGRSDNVAQTLARIQSYDPLFMMGGSFQRGPEMYKLLLRMRLRDADHDRISYQKRYFIHAETAMLLEEYGLAALLYWQGAVMNQDELPVEEVFARFLYCVAKLGENEVRSAFNDEIRSREAAVAEFVEKRYRESPAAL